jgi:PPOX class probable F420-dependent enzyme
VRLSQHEARARFASSRVARLATVGADGQPHLVPIVFAVDGPRLYSTVDAKPKRTAALRRLVNIGRQPRVSVLADHYDEDWRALWWVRADGTGRVVGPDTDDAERARQFLRQRYPQYTDDPLSGPVVVIEVIRWSGWSAAGA